MIHLAIPLLLFAGLASAIYVAAITNSPLAILAPVGVLSLVIVHLTLKRWAADRAIRRARGVRR
jgi:hypothetical protein